MDFEEIVQLINQAVMERKGRPLKTVERIVLQGAWENITYNHIAETTVGYTEDYLKKDVGPSLWKLLTDVVGNNHIKITKRNLQNVLRDWAAQYASSKPAAAIAPPAEHPLEPPAPAPAVSAPLPHWDVPPVDVSDFCGRSQELGIFKAWILEEQCRLITLWGLAGFGKTFLAAAVAQQVREHFQLSCYICLAEDTSPSALIATLAAALDVEVAAAASWDWMLQQLTEKRCLIILDGGEHLFAPGQSAGTYRPEWQEMRDFMQQVAEHQHRSCWLWISREKPQNLTQLEGARVRSHHLTGFTPQEAQTFLSLRGRFSGESADWQQLVEHFSGSPQVLKGLGGTLLEVYRGDLRRFLAEPTGIEADWGDGDPLGRLTPQEQELLSWLALAQAASPLEQLQAMMLTPTTMEVVQSLLARGLCQIVTNADAGIVLDTPPFIRRTVLTQMLASLQTELEEESFGLMQQLPLLWTSAPERVQTCQRQAILLPLTAHLQQQYSEGNALTDKLRSLHQRLRSQFLNQPGYAAGNLIHLCQQLDIGLGGIDFSQLAVWHANLRQGGIQGANFNQAQFAHTHFAMALGRDPVTAFSADGQQLAIGDHDGRLLLWDIPASKLSRVLVEESQMPIRSLAFSADGDWLAVGSEDGSLALWSMTTAYAPEDFNGHQRAIQALVFSPDGTWLATGDEGGSLRIWDLASGTCIHHLSEHQHAIRHLQVSATADRLISCCDDQLACLWDPLGGKLIAWYQGTSNATIHDAGFIQLGDVPLAFTAGYGDRCLVIWELETSRPRWILPTPIEMLLTMKLSRDGRHLVCSHSDGIVTVWDIQQRQQRCQLDGFSSPVWSLNFSPDYRMLVTTNDYSVRFWDLQRGDCLRSLHSLRYPVSSLTFTQDGNQIITGHEDGRVRPWQLTTSAFTRRLHSLKGHRRDVRTVAASPDGRWLASSDGETLRVWCRRTGNCFQNFNETAVVAIAFSSDGNWLVSGGEEGNLQAWPLETEAPPIRFSGHKSAIAALTISPDGNTLVSSSRDRTLRLWNLTTGQALQSIEVHPGYLQDLIFSPDGSYLFSATSDSVYWWHRQAKLVASGDWQPPEGQLIHRILYDPLGNLIAISGDTRTLEVWSVGDNQLISTLQGHTQEIWQVCVSPDHRRLASASLGEEIRVWRLEAGLCEQILRPDRPYEGVSLMGAEGLSDPERLMLKSLGAVMA